MSEKTFGIIQFGITVVTVGIIIAFYNTLDVIMLGGLIACCGAVYNSVAAVYQRRLDVKKYKSSLGLTVVCIIVAVFIFLTSKF